MTVLEPGETVKAECHMCGNEYTRLSGHWIQSTCDYPSFSRRQERIIEGLNLGDGTLDQNTKNCRLVVANSNLRFLEWLEEEFPVMSTGIRLLADAEKLSSYAGIEPSECNYRDAYTLSFRSVPYFTELREKWYPNGDIRFPDDLELTPMSLKVWYVSDGGISWSGGWRPSISIISRNEGHRPGFIRGLFQDIGFDATYSSDEIRIPVSQTQEFLEYIGDPIPGMVYKWAVDDYGKYKELRP